MKQSLIIAILSAILGIVAYETLFPRKPATNPIPIIVTKYDTVATTPVWLRDSIKSWKSKKYLTDTVNLVLSKTVIETSYVNLEATDTSKRPNLYPLLSYHSRGRFGDTAIVSTFALRSGKTTVSNVFVPGYLTDIETDSSSTPRLNFVPFPPPPTPSFLYKVKLLALGFGACYISNKVH